MCTPKSCTDDEVFVFLINTDVFCGMILFLVVDYNALKFPRINNHFVGLEP